MATRGFVRLKAIWRMLNRCAPGHEKVLTQHRWWVTWNGRSYRDLPKGPGRHQDADVRFAYVEKLVAVLRIAPACAGRFFRQMR
jgi:hypothetical protein